MAKKNVQKKQATKNGKKTPVKELQIMMEELQDEDDNFDFEITVQFNKNYCWGLYELLVRGQN